MTACMPRKLPGDAPHRLIRSELRPALHRTPVPLIPPTETNPASHPAPEPKRSGVRIALRVAAILLTGVIIVALGRTLWRDGPAAWAAWRAADVRWSWVIAATVFALAGHVATVVGWRRALIDLEMAVSFWQVARFFLVSNLGRYLPGGKAWQMGIVGVMSAEHGLSSVLVAGISLLQGTVGVAVGAILLAATGGAALGLAGAWLVLPVAGIVGLVISPIVLARLPRLHAAVVRTLPSIASVTPSTMWALVWTAAASWVAWGVALYALAWALLPEPGASIPTYIAAWIGPYLAGLIAIVTPAGLGVRDGAMQAMLGSAMTAGSAMVLVVVTRVWVTILEVIPALALLALRQRRNRTAERGLPTRPLTLANEADTNR
jgi:glycosyltransferase 2 family protein